MTRTSVTSFADAREVNRSLAASEIDVPALTNVMKGYDALGALPDVGDPGRQIVERASSGDLDNDTLKELLTQAANDRLVRDFQAELRRSTETHFLDVYDRALDAGAADEIFNGFRPAVDAAAATIEAAREVIDIRMAAEEFVATAGPAELAAWQTLPPAISNLNAISAFITRTFGARSIVFPVARIPLELGLAWIEDTALLFTDTPQLEHASRVFRERPGSSPRDSPWLRVGTPRLATVAEVREKIRYHAETAWQGAQGPNDLARQRPNPYASVEA